jgi:hypothetical protein
LDGGRSPSSPGASCGPSVAQACSCARQDTHALCARTAAGWLTASGAGLPVRPALPRQVHRHAGPRQYRELPPGRHNLRLPGVPPPLLSPSHNPEQPDPFCTCVLPPATLGAPVEHLHWPPLSGALRAHECSHTTALRQPRCCTQILSTRLGVVNGRHLAQCCRALYEPPTRYTLWLARNAPHSYGPLALPRSPAPHARQRGWAHRIMMEIAIVASDVQGFFLGVSAACRQLVVLGYGAHAIAYVRHRSPVRRGHRLCHRHQLPLQRPRPPVGRRAYHGEHRKRRIGKKQ